MKKRSLASLWGALFRRDCEIQNNLFSGQALALTKDDKFHPVQSEIKSGFIALLAVFQQVAAAQQGGFARPRRADQRNHMAARGHQIDAFQHDYLLHRHEQQR